MHLALSFSGAFIVTLRSLHKQGIYTTTRGSLSRNRNLRFANALQPWPKPSLCTLNTLWFKKKHFPYSCVQKTNEKDSKHFTSPFSIDWRCCCCPSLICLNQGNRSWSGSWKPWSGCSIRFSNQGIQSGCLTSVFNRASWRSFINNWALCKLLVNKK